MLLLILRLPAGFEGSGQCCRYFNAALVTGGTEYWHHHGWACAACLLARHISRHVGFCVIEHLQSGSSRILCSHRFGINVADRLLGGIWAEKFDHLATVTNFVITPLAFLSGTFYSVQQLPVLPFGSRNIIRFST